MNFGSPIFQLTFLLATTWFKVTTTSGVFEIRLNSFENYRGVDSKGTCCAGEKSVTSDRCVSGQCSTYFMVCLKHYQAKIVTESHTETNLITSIRDPSTCTFGSFITPVLGRNSFHGNNQIYTLPFSFSWPGTFSLILEAWNNNSLTNNNNEERLISRLATQRSATADSQWTEDVHLTTYTKLKYSYRIVCNRNYYGDKCANLCKPRDDKFGHYVCGPNGQKVCRQGWTGPYCSQAICSRNCNAEFGYCEKPDECKCRLGYQGKFCDDCIRFPGCLHGTCHQPWQCNCKEGWGGLFCNQDLNYCTNHKPCQNGATCFNTGQGSYTCKCAPGFHGKTCSKTADQCDDSLCQNGGSCKVLSNNNHTCTCLPGFQGNQCEINTFTCADKPCSNGGTCLDLADGGYKCLCDAPFSGLACHLKSPLKPLIPAKSQTNLLNSLTPQQPHSIALDGNCAIDPCLNGGTCYEHPNSPSSFTCRCVPGFTGSLCQTDVPDCAIQPCANGATCIDLVNDYMCQCTPGYAGKDCTVDVDECAMHSEGQESPCANNGTCVDAINGYTCTCELGFYGTRCESALGSSDTEAVKANANNDRALDSDLDRFEALNQPGDFMGVGNSAAQKATPADLITGPGLNKFLSNTEIIMVVCLSVSFVTVTLAILGALFVYKKKLMGANETEEGFKQRSGVGVLNNSNAGGKGIGSGLAKNPMLPTITEDVSYLQDASTIKGSSTLVGKKKCTWEDKMSPDYPNRSLDVPTAYSTKFHNNTLTSNLEYPTYSNTSEVEALFLNRSAHLQQHGDYYQKSSMRSQQTTSTNLFNQTSSQRPANKKSLDVECIYNEPKRLNTLPRNRADTRGNDVTDHLMDSDDDFKKPAHYKYDIEDQAHASTGAYPTTVDCSTFAKTHHSLTYKTEQETNLTENNCSPTDYDTGIEIEVTKDRGNLVDSLATIV